MNIPVNIKAYQQAEIKVKAICQTLFSTTPITDIYYGRVYTDRKYIGVTSNTAWFEEYLIKFPEYLIPKNILGDNEGFLLSASINPPELLELSKSHQITDAINFYTKHHDYTEEFGFATDSPKIGMLEFYLNHLKLLEDFMDYFLEEIDPLLKDKKLIIQMPEELFTDESKPLFSVKYDVRQLNFTKKNIETLSKSLSDREIMCFKLILQGKTRDEIAKELHLSISSVGTYLSRTMEKLNCKTRSDLVAYAWENGIITLNKAL